jgi:Flp pilus assembly protein TadD
MAAMRVVRSRWGQPQHKRRRTASIALALIVTIVLLSVASIPVRERRQIDALSQSVRKALDRHDLDQAALLLDHWVVRRPHDGAVDYYQAELAVKREQPAEAMIAIRRALERHYPEPPLKVLQAVLQARAGHFEPAESVLRQARDTAARPKPEIAEALARIYLGTFRLTEASRVLQWWAEVAPDDVRPYLWRNQIEERTSEDPASLLGNYREALRIDPDHDAARLGLADSLRKARRLDEADTEYATFLGRNPSSVAGHVGAGQVARLKGDLSAATRHFNEALAIDPKDPVALRELGLIDIRNGRYSQARDLLATAVQVAPDDTELRYNYALALKLAGEDAHAAEETLITDRLRAEQQRIAELRRALTQNPGDDDLRCEVARWLIEHGHEEEGLEWTELILRKKPGHPPTCRLLSEYYAKKGNLGLANYYQLGAAPSLEKPPR